MQNSNNLHLDLLFKFLVKDIEILEYYLNSFLGCNHIVKLLTLSPLPGAFGGFIAIAWATRVLPECTLSFSQYFDPVHVMLQSSLKLHLAMSFFPNLSLKLYLELSFLSSACITLHTSLLLGLPCLLG